MQDGGLLFPLGPVNLGLPLALGFGDFGGFDGGGGLFPLHGLLYARRRVNFVDGDIPHLDAPAPGVFIQGHLQLPLNPLPFRQSLGQGDVADDGAQFGYGQVDHGRLEVLHIQHRLAGIVALRQHLVVDDKVQVHHHVVRGDVFLGRHPLGVFPHRHADAAIDKGDEETQPRPHDPDKAAETLNYHPFLLLNYDDSRSHSTSRARLNWVICRRSVRLLQGDDRQGQVIGFDDHYPGPGGYYGIIIGYGCPVAILQPHYAAGGQFG